MDEIHFIDTTIRDGNTSVWATNMRAGMMLPALPHLDNAGFDGIEFFVALRLKKIIRDLKEDPWDWVRLGTQAAKKTRLIYHGGLRAGFDPTPECMSRLMIERIVSYGVTLTRHSNPWNDFKVFGEEMATLRDLGMDTVANIIYAVSPRHTDEYYARKAREAAALKPYAICFKDVGGMLTPERTFSLARIIKENVGAVPLEFHAHCNNGLAPYNLLQAVKAGIRIVHTAVPPLANGSSQPSVFNVAANLRALGYRPVIDEKLLEPVEKHFRWVAQQEGLPVGTPREYDEGLSRHQIPGGMTSNLRHQLKTIGREERIDEVIEEIAQVRADLGYPIMVTPFAQFVGSQAAINVITGERYKQVTDQVIQYALGIWGKEGPEVMDPEIKVKVLDRPRAREFEDWRMPQPTLNEIKQKYGYPGISDEDLLSRYFAGPEFFDAMRAAGPRREYPSAEQPLLQLVKQLVGNKALGRVYIRRPEFSLTIGRKDPGLRRIASSGFPKPA